MILTVVPKKQGLVYMFALELYYLHANLNQKLTTGMPESKTFNPVNVVIVHKSNIANQQSFILLHKSCFSVEVLPVSFFFLNRVQVELRHLEIK